MHRLTCFTALFLLLAACGGSNKPAETPDVDHPEGEAKADMEGDGKGEEGGEEKADGKPGAPKKDECVGFEIGNLEEVLLKSGCEETGVSPDSVQPIDLKGKLEVTATASPTKVPVGGKTDLLVTFTNKSKEPLTLHFRIDPVPRFEPEAYDAKGAKRIDMPAGKPPPPPKGHSAPPPSEAKTARVTLAPNGSARAKVAWEAVKTRWAPSLVRGTPPERGYPRLPAGPLAKGKAVVRVQTPLVGVSEGSEKEMTAPKLEIEIEK